MRASGMATSELSIQIYATSDVLEALEDAWPALAHALESQLVRRPEAGLLHPNERAAVSRHQRPGHDGDEAAGRFRAVSPAVAEQMRRIDGQHLAIGNAGPAGQGSSAEGEAMADLGNEIVLQEPFGDQVALGQCPPHLFGWMVHLPLEAEADR